MPEGCKEIRQEKSWCPLCGIHCYSLCHDDAQWTVLEGISLKTFYWCTISGSVSFFSTPGQVMVLSLFSLLSLLCSFCSVHLCLSDATVNAPLCFHSLCCLQWWSICFLLDADSISKMLWSRVGTTKENFIVLWPYLMYCSLVVCF